MVLPGLEWIANGYQPGGSTDQLADAIIWKAWQRIANDQIRDRLGPIIVDRLKHHDASLGSSKYQAFQTDLAMKPTQRRLFVETLVRILKRDKDAAYLLVYVDPRFVRVDDIPWMLKCLDEAESEHQPTWASVIAAALQVGGLEYFDIVYGASQHHPTLALQTAPIWQPIDLQSDVARRGHDSYIQLNKLQQQQPEPIVIQIVLYGFGANWMRSNTTTQPRGGISSIQVAAVRRPPYVGRDWPGIAYGHSGSV